MIHWIRALFRRKPRDYTSEFPQHLSTRTCGDLRLNVSSILVHNEVAVTFCHYSKEKADQKFGASFHPKISEPPNVVRWAEIFDRRFTEAENSWGDLLRAGSDPIAARVTGWLNDGVTLEELFQSLELTKVLVSDDESITVRFATSSHLKHHDLGIELSVGNKVLHVEIEG